MDKLVEKTLGEFLSDLVTAVSIGIFVLFLVGPIEEQAGAVLPLPISPDAGAVANLNWIIPFFLAYLLGELCISAGSSVISFCSAKAWNWDEPAVLARKLARSDTVILLNGHFRLAQKYHLLCGMFAGSSLSFLSLLISLLNPTNRNAMIAESASISLAVLGIAGFTAVMALRRIQQQCETD